MGDYLPPVAAHLSKEQFLELLADIRRAVKNDDTWEGNLNWALPGPYAPPTARYAVSGAFRVGPGVGAGGVRVIAAFPPPGDTEASSHAREAVAVG